MTLLQGTTAWMNDADEPAAARARRAAANESPCGDAGPVRAHERLDDLAQIIAAYNRVTEDLQHSHEALRQQVVRLQQELASTDAQLQRSRRLAALGEMAAGIAHEIRNPLAAIRLYAQALEEDLGRLRDFEPGEEPPELVPTLHATAAKVGSVVRGLNAIVIDVLHFAREVKPRRQPVVIEALFDRVVEAHRPAMDEAGVAVRRVMPRGARPMALHADFDLLHQAMLNLVRNAVEAMADRRHRGPRVLTLAARRDDGLAVLAVRDTGPGIAEQDVDRIFNPFFTTRNTGTGLGLAIVHRIVDAHGGTIVVHNDGGAVFELTLPLGDADEASETAG